MPAARIQIRPARADDYSRLIQLWTKAGLSHRPTARDSRAAYEQQVAQFPGLFLLAVDGERLVGSVFGTHDGRKGWINRLAVDPDYRRQGIGTALTLACDTALRECGIEIVAALIEPENAASLKLFKGLGYTDDAPVVYVRRLSRPDV